MRFRRNAMHSFHAVPARARPLAAILFRPNWPAAASEAQRIARGVGEQFHALVDTGNRAEPIKFHPMTDAEARRRNASIRTLGYEWRRQEPMR